MKIKNLGFVILASCFLLLASSPSALAQEFSSGINPTVLEIKAESPASIKAPLTLENSSDQTITYGIFLRPFRAGSELNGEPNYDPDLIEEYKDFFTKVQVYDGLGPISEITLNAKEKKDLILRINLENSPVTRDYYFTVVFLSTASMTEALSTSINTRGAVGTNVLLTVGPETPPEGRITRFLSPRIVGNGPVGFTLELANHSNYFVSSKGNLVIRNMFGQIVGNVEFGPTNILANSNRLLNLNWNEKFLFGVYKADLSVALSDRGPLLNESKIFFALPFKALFIIISIIFIAVWLISNVRKKSQEE